jgi:hypothetical protein
MWSGITTDRGWHGRNRRPGLWAEHTGGKKQRADENGEESHQQWKWSGSLPDIKEKGRNKTTVAIDSKHPGR